MRMVLRIALLAPIALGYAASAQAQTQISTQECKNKPEGGTVCTTRSFTEAPNAPPRPLAPRESAEVNARIVAWENYCKPRIKIDREGVGRYQYAHEGCEYGRSGDELPLSSGCLLSASDACHSLSTAPGLTSSADGPARNTELRSPDGRTTSGAR